MPRPKIKSAIEQYEELAEAPIGSLVAVIFHQSRRGLVNPTIYTNDPVIVAGVINRHQRPTITVSVHPLDQLPVPEDYHINGTFKVVNAKTYDGLEEDKILLIEPKNTRDQHSDDLELR